MKALAVAALALIVGGERPSPESAANPSHLCLPQLQRTTPRGPYERTDKWQHDQRTIA